MCINITHRYARSFPPVQRKTVNPYESAAKMAQVLKTNTFESGAHIDFYDV